MEDPDGEFESLWTAVNAALGIKLTRTKLRRHSLNRSATDYVVRKV